jgi:hypothetical protein
MELKLPDFLSKRQPLTQQYNYFNFNPHRYHINCAMTIHYNIRIYIFTIKKNIYFYYKKVLTI